MTVRQVVAGYQLCEKYSDEELFVHCKGSKENFIQPEDIHLRLAFTVQGMEFIPYTTIPCTSCIEQEHQLRKDSHEKVR